MDKNTTYLQHNPYPKFALIMAISFVVMYLVMFLNVADFSHIYISLTRLYMTTLMIAIMAITMLLLMWKMYPNLKVNLFIVLFVVSTFGGSLFLLRTQAFVSDM